MSDQVTKRLKMDEGSGSSVQRKSMSPKKTCIFTTQMFIAITETAAFVDKSLFIKAFLEDNNEVIVALAPRRFGKSTNMDMLKEFLSGNREIFEKNCLKIYTQEETFFNKNCKENPIIHVDFKSVGGETKDEVLRSMKTTIQSAYGNHKYLVKKEGKNYVWSDEKLDVDFTVEKFIEYWLDPKQLSRDEVIVGFKRLSQCLYVYHGKPVYVLIDEYDAPIMKAIMKTISEQNIIDGTIDLISDIMSNFLKGNVYVKRGLLNACVRIAQALSHDANNIEYYEFLDIRNSFVGYYGFTAQEVQDLFEREEFVAFKNDGRIQQWYNGYQVMETGASVYSSYSILKYLDISRKKEEQTFDTYWVGTGSIRNMKALFARYGIREHIEKLINGEEIEIITVRKMSVENVQTLKSLINENINEIDIAQAHLFIQFLADIGYLNVIKRDKDSFKRTSTLKIPNEEIKNLLIDECYNAEFLVSKYKLKAKNIHNYTDAIYSVLEERNENAFIILANAVSDLFDKCNMPTNEDELHCILFTLVYNVKLYHVRSELSVKRIKQLGRPPCLDILVILGSMGMIIELKCKNESSEKAHKQIETAGYSTVFDEPPYNVVTKKIFVGLHMDANKKVDITYSVDATTPEKTISSRERRVD